MQKPAVYDLQTEKFAFPSGDRFSIGTAGDVRTPIDRPWGNRGGVENIERLLEAVEAEHATVEIDDDGAYLRPNDPTATIYVDSARVEGEGRRLRTGETIVLGRAKSELWEGYRVQVFF